MTGRKLSLRNASFLIGLSFIGFPEALAEQRYAWEVTTREIPSMGGRTLAHDREFVAMSVAQTNVGEALETDALSDQESIEHADIQVNGADLAAAEAELREGADEQPLSKSAHEAKAKSYDLSRENLPELGLLDVLELALANNPEVGAALAREEQAKWFHRESQAYKYPVVDVISEYGPEYNRPATNTSDNEDITPGRSLNLRVRQLLYDGGVSESEEARRYQVRRSTEIETRLVVEDLSFETAQAYLLVLQYQQAAAAAEEFVVAMQRIVDQIEVMHEAGAASKLELDFAKARLASAQAETGNTAAQLNDAVSDLEFLTGDLTGFTALPPQSLDDLRLGTLDYFLAEARENNATIRLNQSNKSAQRMKIRAEKRQYSPILSINLGSRTLGDEGGNQAIRNTSEVKLKAEYFLYDGGARRSRLNRSKAQLRELEWEDERLLNRLERDVKQAYNQITTNRITLDATQEEIKYNLELQRLNEQNLEHGDISIIELIEVEERLFNSQATWARVSTEMLQSYYALLIEVGRLDQIIANDLMYSRLE